MNSEGPDPEGSLRRGSYIANTNHDAEDNRPLPGETTWFNDDSILLNDPWKSEQQQTADTASATTSTATPETPQATPEEEDIRKCWICQQDETEDEAPVLWRSPCPCSLVAHDACLLEWIADEEAPKKDQIATPSSIRCPQCKVEYNIKRPRDLLVDLFTFTQSVTRKGVLPLVISGVLGCCYTGLFAYGANTIYVVFGKEEGQRIFESLWKEQAQGSILNLAKKLIRWPEPTQPSVLRWMKNRLLASDPFFPSLPWNFQLTVGVPLIAPALVLLRTELADWVFPLLAPIFFLGPTQNELFLWPPSPSLTIAALPYMRTAYNKLYRYTFAGLEKKWELAVQRQPREGETAEQIAQQANDDEDRLIELEIVGEMLEPRQPGWMGVAAFGDEAQQHDMPLADAQGDGPADRPEDRLNNNQGAVQGFRQEIPIAKTAIKVTGALALPLISSLVGELLYTTLPRRWVGKGYMEWSERGLLSEKWGRTIVGGCLFVVLKDVVTLYCKWKQAKDFGKREILDYVGPKGGRR